MVVVSVCALLAVISTALGDSALKTLDDDNFEHLTQAATGATTGDWLVVFSMDHEKCPKCKEVEEAFEKVHEKLGHKVNVAKVWPTGSKLTHDRFEVQKWPSVLLFHHGRMYTYPHGQYEEEDFLQFLDGGFAMAANVPVPPPSSAFDVFMVHLMEDIKHITSLRKNAAGVIFVAGILCGLLLNSALSCLLGYLMSTFLQEPDENEEPEDDQGGEEQQDTDQDDDPTEEGEPDAEEVGWAGEEVGEQQDRARSRKSQARANNKKTK